MLRLLAEEGLSFCSKGGRNFAGSWPEGLSESIAVHDQGISARRGL